MSNDPSSPPKATLTIADVVRLYGFTARHWRRKAAAGEIPGATQFFGLRGHWTFDADELRKLSRLRRRERAPWPTDISAGKFGGAASNAKSRIKVENTVGASKQRTETLLND